MKDNPDKLSFDSIIQLVKQAQEYGVRRLLVISGQQSWCYQQSQYLKEILPGDWLWVSYHQDLTVNRISADKAHLFLGREIKHAVFDGTEGIDADALAAISGALVAGSLLVLLVPEWQAWDEQIDKDSLRWSEQPYPIATPHFVKHIKMCLLWDPDVLTWRQNSQFQGNLLSGRKKWCKPEGRPTEEQQTLLQQLLTAKPDNYVLTANRGRGKSSLAGMLINNWQGKGECWLTGPNKLSAEVVSLWSDNKAKFIAPDLLIERCQQQKIENVDWLIIDEAAAIPSSLLYQLLPFFSRILFTTTVLGYEGTGRGFLLKFCVGLPHWQRLMLSAPVRWAENDPLERLIDTLLLFNAEDDVVSMVTGAVESIELSQEQFSQDLSLLRQFYGLLTSAHYRTTPLDLRRLLDAPKMVFQAAIDSEERIIGGLWSVKEGGLPGELAHEVWAGRRRPRGNLVAQSLSAHAGLYNAPILNSVRISRIAVQAEFRRLGIAQKLIHALAKQSKKHGDDYLSVSFGYTDELWQFWHACGFKLIHIGSQKEASSGCYAAMAILPFTPEGEVLLENGLIKFLRNQPRQIAGKFSASIENVSTDCQLDEFDWCELAGFAFGYRNIESIYGALQRLLLNYENNHAEILKFYIQNQCSISELAHQFQLSGKKELIKMCRKEIAEILFQVNFEKTFQLQQWVVNSQFK